MIKFQIAKNYRFIFHTVCLMIFLSACSLIPGGITPADAVRKTFSSLDFQVAGERKLNEGVIVLYHNPRPDIIPGDPENPSFQLGFSYVDHRDGRWWTRSGKFGSFTPDLGSKLIFLVGQVQTNDQDPKRQAGDPTAPLIVFGKILDQTIATIELDNGEEQILRDSPSDSMFALLETDGSIPCTLRFLNAFEAVVEEYDLADLAEWQVSAELAKMIKASCSAQP